MAHVVHLKIETIAKWLDSRVAVAVCNQDGSMNVAVRSLCPADDLDDFFQTSIPFGIGIGGLQCADRFQPFIEVPIIKRRAAVLALR